MSTLMSSWFIVVYVIVHSCANSTNYSAKATNNCKADKFLIQLHKIMNDCFTAIVTNTSVNALDDFDCN